MFIRFLMLKHALEDLLVISKYRSVPKKYYAIGKSTLKVLSLVCFIALHNKIRTS